MPIKLDSKAFQRRVGQLISLLGDDVNSILIAVGNAEDDSYSKSTSLQMWLLGYEFPDTAFCIGKEKVCFLTSQKKGNILDSLSTASGAVTIEVFKRSKDIDHNKKMCESFLAFVKEQGTKLGQIVKDKFKGKFIEEFQKYKSECEAVFEPVDVSSHVSTALSIKDEDELKLMKSASRMTTLVMKNYFISELEGILDDDRRISHEAFTEKVEKCLDDSYRKRLKIPTDVEFNTLDWCYPPIIQSGGEFDLRPSVESNSKNLHAGVIYCSLGVKFKSYCSNIGRTFLIDPEKSKEKNYKFLLEVQDHVLTGIRDGASCKDIYNRYASFVEKKRPDLKDNLVKNIGFGMGLEFRESAFILGPKNSREVKNGMVLNLAIGLQNLVAPDVEDPKSKNYSLMVIDAVLVSAERSVILTEVTKEPTDVCYVFKDPEQDAEKSSKADETAGPSNGAEARRAKASAVIQSKLRGEGNQADASSEQKRKQHQKELVAQRLTDGLARYAEGDDESQTSKKQVFRRFESYKKETQLPNETRDLRVLVDRRNQSVILPIYGLAVPFHITTLKNVSKTEDRDFVYLRFNFMTPGQSGKKDSKTVPYEDPDATFVRAITFKSSDSYRFNEIFRDINDLKKEIQKREAHREEMSDLVEQAKLVEIRGKRPIRLNDVFIRPALEGKKFPGEVEIHSNGLRYMPQVRNDQKVDVLFSNIKHFFFQPCNHELLVLVHINLKDPIMIGKKKTKDVQFYREVADANFDETGNRKRRYNYGDEDELVAEQEERRRRAQLNREFKEFSQSVAEAGKGAFEVDVPFRDLSFHGVPHRQLVLMQPTTDCLVHLTEPPFVVVSLTDIEIVHLERIQFGLKNFDLVIVFRNFDKQPIHINTIPMNQLDNVKEWLDSVDVPFTEGPVNLNWGQIMKTVNDDRAGFFAEGGWGFLQVDSDQESQESESASEFEGSGGDSFGGESSSEDYSSDEISDSGSGSESGDESGEDWDELEKKAARKDDRKRAKDSDSDEEPKRKRR